MTDRFHLARFNIARLAAPLESGRLSVWKDVASLQAFVYNSRHREFVRRRRDLDHVNRPTRP